MVGIRTLLQQRREERRHRLERTGDTPERVAERSRAHAEPSVEEATRRASTAIVSNSAPFQG